MKQYSKEEKAKRLEDWRRSVKSLRAYAKENGINPQTFTKWTKKQEEPVFVQIPSTARPEIPGEILIEKGEIKIHLPAHITAQELCVLVKSLGSFV